MNILLHIVPHNLPVIVRQEIVAELSAATADAFGCVAPPLDHLSFEERLRTYALFTQQQAEKALQGGRDIATLKARLYENAFRLGQKLRKWFGLEMMEEVMALGQLLYRAIEVEMEGDAQGDVTVTRCYFSQFYAPAICDLISALDDGIFSGLSAGGRLTFSQRLTEGSTCCRAKLEQRGN